MLPFWNLQKLTISFRTSKSTLAGSLKLPEMSFSFCENSPGIFHFFTLTLEIPDKTKINPWIFHKIVSARSLGNAKAKNKDPCKFHIIFSWSPLEIPLHF